MTDTLLAIAHALAQPFSDPAARTFWPVLLCAGLIAVVWHKAQGLRGGSSEALGFRLWAHPSSQLDLQLLVARRLLSIIGLMPVIGGAWWLAITISTQLDHVFGIPSLKPGPWLGLGYTILLFVVWDLSRFVVHFALHRVRFLWAFHQVHHSAQVLTPLTFHRTHPVESLVYSLRGVLTTGTMGGLAFWLYRGAAVEWTLLGVHSLGLVMNAFSGNLRHSHLWIRFPVAVERWLISPAQHQLHHALAPEHHDTNFGTWLACWDRLAGTLKPAPRTPVTALGLAAPNHDPQQLLSVLAAPFRDAVSMRNLGHLSLGLCLVFSLTASADSETNGADGDDADPSNDSTSMMIIADRNDNRVAGAAHVITEEALERHGYTDIHKVLAGVPGVYIRSEDGFGLRPNIGLRGGNSDRSAKITLMEDGVPLSPAPYAAPAAYYFPMTTRMVGVEVIKGASSIRFGPQTIGGAINLLTRRIPNEDTIAETKLSYGAFNTVKVHAFTGHGADRWGILGEVAQISSSGFKDIDGGGASGFVRTDAMVKGRWNTDRSESVFGEFQLKAGYGRERSHETYLGLSAPDFKAAPDRRYSISKDDLMQWNRQQLSLRFRLLAGQNFDFSTVVYHHKLERDWEKVNGFDDGTSIGDLLYTNPETLKPAAYLAVLQGRADSSVDEDRILKGSNDRSLANTGVSNTGHWRIATDIFENELEFGLRWHTDDVMRLHTQQAFDVRDGRLIQSDGLVETTLNSHTSATAIALHLHDDFRIGKLSLLPGIRHERISTQAENEETHSIWLPGMGLYFQALDWLGLLAGANKGFSPIPPGSEADAVPETAWNYESGLRLNAGEAHAELVGFFSDYANITGQCTLSGGCTDAQLDTQHNGGSATVAGIETSAGHIFNIGAGWRLGLDAAYALTQAQFGSNFSSDFPQFGMVTAGDALPYVPTHQGSAALRFEHDRGHLSTRVSGRSAMRNQAGTNTEDQPIDPSMSLDVATEFRCFEHLSATASVTNLTNHRTIASWRPYGARPTAPRIWTIGLKAKL